MSGLVLAVHLFGQENGYLFTPDRIRQFANYLFDEGDYLRAASEYERYLFFMEDGDDSTLFKIGLCYQLLNHHDKALSAYRELRNNPQGTTLDSLVQVASIYSSYKLESWEEIRAMMPANDEEFYFYYYAQIMNNPRPVDKSFFGVVKDNSLRKSLWKLEQNRQNLRRKSPVVAGALSAFLPGVGKMYYGHIGDGLFSLAATSFAGFVSYMAFREDRDLTGLVTAGITMSFYLGTIYGSYMGAMFYNERTYLDWKTELNRFNPVEQNPYWERWH